MRKPEAQVPALIVLALLAGMIAVPALIALSSPPPNWHINAAAWGGR